MDLLNAMPVLRKPLNPTIALIVGFLLGGIGLGIYLRSVLDGFMVVIVTIVLASQLAAGGWLLGAALAAGYGALRVHSSNERLEARAQ
jgi:hypothetical protein